MPEHPEPTCPAGTPAHRDRVACVVRLCPINKTAGVVISNTREQIDYYLQELGKHKEIEVKYHGRLTDNMYLINITKHAVN